MVYFSPLPVALAQMKSGRLRGLAVTSKQRVSLVGDLPTIAESGYPAYEFNLWNGLIVHAKTPKETVAAIHKAVLAALHSPDVSKRMTEMSSNVVGSQPEEFGAFIKSEVDAIAKLTAKLNLTAQ
jgi:tripartite-type tricarboxylate transporter receptor subunit TctC